jgi:hypothetical protein
VGVEIPPLVRRLKNIMRLIKKVADKYRIAFMDITPISVKGILMPSLVASVGLHPSEV